MMIFEIINLHFIWIIENKRLTYIVKLLNTLSNSVFDNHKEQDFGND